MTTIRQVIVKYIYLKYLFDINTREQILSIKRFRETFTDERLQFALRLVKLLDLDQIIRDFSRLIHHKNKINLAAFTLLLQ